MPRTKTTMTEEVGEYLAKHSRQDDVLARIEEETSAREDSMMQVTPDEGALLTMLARLTNARDALEVGTFTGYSAVCIARGLAPGGHLMCLELDPEFAVIAQQNVEAAGLQDRVTIESGEAAPRLARTPAEPTYDFVFVDADKTGYPTYYDLLVPRLRQNGLLLLDNVLLRGRVTDPQDDRARTIDRLNDRITADDRVDSVMTFVADGLTLVRKR